MTGLNQRDAGSVIRQLQEVIREKDAEIRRLKQELHRLREENWETDACGDDMWDLE